MYTAESRNVYKRNVQFPKMIHEENDKYIQRQHVMSNSKLVCINSDNLTDLLYWRAIEATIELKPQAFWESLSNAYDIYRRDW